MAKKLQILRGTTAQNDAYTGSIGELTMDTEKVEVRIHDGTTQGGKTIGSGGGASLPILTHVFSDHKLNDISWLNADTFSWQSGDVYVAAYEHLVDDIAVSDDGYITTENGVVFNRDSSKDKDGLIAWTSTDSITVYTSNAPAIGEVPSSWDDTRQVWGVYGSTISSGSNVAYQETVGGVTITFYRAEDGHKICLADQEANVQAIYEATGVAWYYILDTANKQFKLPRTKFGFTGLRDTVGGYVPAGLPNITGIFYGSQSAFETAYGAFKVGNNPYGGKTASGTVNNEVFFDASRSSSIYGNSTTVQPKATQMYLYFYVGNFEREAIEQTAGITAEMFSNKADVSDIVELQNKTRHVVVEFQEPTSSNNNTWYRIYNDGWVEQGGTVKGSWEIAAGEEKIPSVTVPIPVNRHNAHAFFSTRELYCLIMGYYWENDSTIRPRFGAYQVKRTLSEFKYVVYGMLA